MIEDFEFHRPIGQQFQHPTLTGEMVTIEVCSIEDKVYTCTGCHFYNRDRRGCLAENMSRQSYTTKSCLNPTVIFKLVDEINLNKNKKMKKAEIKGLFNTTIQPPEISPYIDSIKEGLLKEIREVRERVSDSHIDWDHILDILKIVKELESFTCFEELERLKEKVEELKDWGQQWKNLCIETFCKLPMHEQKEFLQQRRQEIEEKEAKVDKKEAKNACCSLKK